VPSYDITLHPTAQNELNNLSDSLQEAIKEQLEDVAQLEQPTEHSKVKFLQGHKNLFRVRASAENAQVRAICRLSKPNLQVVLIGQRNTVYRDVDDVKQRIA